jgi:hypothetical protein
LKPLAASRWSEAPPHSGRETTSGIDRNAFADCTAGASGRIRSGA